MPSLPPASVLIIDTPTVSSREYGRAIDTDHTVDVVRTEDELAEFPPASHDLVFVDDRHPSIDPRTIAHRLVPEAKLALITDSEPADIGTDSDYDDYLLRPLTAWDVERSIDSLRARQVYISRVDDHFEIACRMAEVEATTDDPHADPEYQTLISRAEAVQAELTTLFETVSSLDDPAKIFYDLQPRVTPELPPRPATLAD